ncbi:MAG TPA: four helix bundle protein [Verrucomicrobiae bacterium]|nr:four helix bundle protein [Verrucomicrobiae bacterium]
MKPRWRIGKRRDTFRTWQLEVGMMTFEQLEAWREAKALAVRAKPLATDFGLRDQIQRAAVSIMSNIAEGYERMHILEKRQFYNAARASCGEVRSQLHLLREIGFIRDTDFVLLADKANRVGRLTSGLLRSIENRR